MENFVPIDRSIVDHWIYKDAEYFKVWFEMLFRARYSLEPKTDMYKGIIYTIEYGEFMFGRPSWSQRLGISEQRLKTLIKKLVEHEMITLTKTYRYFSIYYINNFEKYRKSNQQNNQQNNQQEYLEPQEIDDDSNQQNNQQTNLLSTSYQPAANLLSTTKEDSSNTVKKVKKKKEEKILYKENVSLTESEYKKLCDEYGEELTLESIEYLSLYKIEKAYKTKSDNLTIRRWVMDATKKKRGGNFGKSQQSNQTTGSGGNKKESEFAFLDINKPSKPVVYDPDIF